MTATDSFHEVFSELNRILIVLAHPDDMEVTCGGLIARLTDEEKKVRLVVATNGGKGTKGKTGINEKDFGDTRVEEQLKAGEILGIPKEENFNLCFPDGELEPNLQTIEKIVFHIRDFKPDIVITHNPEDYIIKYYDKSTWINHKDHKNTAVATIDSIYPCSRDTNFFPNQLSENNLAVHKVFKFLLTDSYTKPELKYFDISKFTEKKKLALQQHSSQFSPEDVDDYVEESKTENGYFEPLAFYTIY